MVLRLELVKPKIFFIYPGISCSTDSMQAKAIFNIGGEKPITKKGEPLTIQVLCLQNFSRFYNRFPDEKMGRILLPFRKARSL